MFGADIEKRFSADSAVCTRQTTYQIEVLFAVNAIKGSKSARVIGASSVGIFIIDTDHLHWLARRMHINAFSIQWVALLLY